MTKSTGDRWMSTAEVAEHLGVVVRTVYVLINSGELPAYKVGRVLRVKTADVEAFLEAHRVEPGSIDHLSPPIPTARSAGLRPSSGELGPVTRSSGPK